MVDRLDDVVESYRNGKDQTKSKLRRHSWSEADRAAAIARAQSRVFEHARHRRDSRIQGVKNEGIHLINKKTPPQRSDSIDEQMSQAPSEDTSLASGAVLHADEWNDEVDITFLKSAPFGLKLKLLMRRQPRAIIVSGVRSKSPAFGLIEPGDLLVAWTENGGNITELFFDNHDQQKLNKEFFADLIDRLSNAPRPFNLIFRRRKESPSALGRARAEIARITSTPPKTSSSPSCDLDNLKHSPIDGLSATEKAKREVQRISDLAKSPPRNKDEEIGRRRQNSSTRSKTVTINRRNSHQLWHQQQEEDEWPAEDDGSDILPPDNFDFNSSSQVTTSRSSIQHTATF